MRLTLSTALLSPIVLLVACGTGTERPTPGSLDDPATLTDACEDASYSTTIQPIFDSTCLQCHWANAALGGLQLQSIAGVLQGGVSGPSVIPGDCASSLLYQRVAGQTASPMPPVGYPSLDYAEVACICRWIAEGGLDD